MSNEYPTYKVVNVEEELAGKTTSVNTIRGTFVVDSAARVAEASIVELAPGVKVPGAVYLTGSPEFPALATDEGVTVRPYHNIARCAVTPDLVRAVHAHARENGLRGSFLDCFAGISLPVKLDVQPSGLVSGYAPMKDEHGNPMVVVFLRVEYNHIVEDDLGDFASADLDAMLTGAASVLGKKAKKAAAAAAATRPALDMDAIASIPKLSEDDE